MKTRLDKQPHRFSILSDTVPKCTVSRKLQRSTTKKRPDISKEDQQQQSYLEQLHHEAFDELRLQLQHYNDEFILRMQYLEQTRDFLYKEDQDMQDLEASFNAASVKDFSMFEEKPVTA